MSSSSGRIAVSFVSELLLFTRRTMDIETYIEYVDLHPDHISGKLKGIFRGCQHTLVCDAGKTEVLMKAFKNLLPFHDQRF
jgi:hypothetical protein